MKVNEAALVLEGGGLRGVYTSGVLRFLVDKQIFFPYVIGVSMGACNGANYVSLQPERNRIVNIRYVNDARYLSYIRLLFRGELFGMKFIFDTIPHKLVPFDAKTFMDSPITCVITATDCETGEALYYSQKALGRNCLKVLQASCSLPFMAKPVRYKDRVLMDGGLADAVPIRKSIAEGFQKNVLVLTRPRGYRKKRTRFMRLTRMRYAQYPGLCRIMAIRHIRYNETMDFVDRLESCGDVYVIRPLNELKAKRIERNKDRLYETYDQGYADAAAHYEGLRGYLAAGE